MTFTWDEVLKWAPLFTAVVVPLFGYFGRRALVSIHKLVNDRLDKALERIDDLEKIVKRSDMSDTGSTAESLRSPKAPI